MERQIDALLERAVKAGASDIHLKVGSAPVIRVDGALKALDGFETLRPAETQAYAEAIFSPVAAKNFKETGMADFAYGRHDIGRFRAAAFRQRGSVSLVLRRVVPGSRSFEDLGLPKELGRFASARSGLILVTGPSGSGKTTTLASIIDWVNSNRSAAIITVEDPIEVLHPDKLSVVAQREVGVDTATAEEAIRGALRHDADVIMVSEITDAATARAVIDASETGHLVVSSMRSIDPADTINRLVAMFPESERRVVRGQLASQVQAIVSQILIETNGPGKVLACEVLTNNERAQQWIMSGEDAPSLVKIISESGYHGMQTFDQALLAHVVERSVKIDAALPFARNTHEMKAKAMAAGVSV